jgi:polyferredoxin
MPAFMQWSKYGFLGITVILVAYFWGKEVPAFFCTYCPTATIESIIPAMIFSPDYLLGAAGHWRFLVLAVVLFLAVANHRSFCKIMCPVGALVAITNKFSLFSMKLSADKCIHCHKCDRSCPMDVAVEKCTTSRNKINRDLECIECLTCEGVCPTTAITNNSRIVHK